MKQTEVLRLLPERDLCPRRLLQSIYRQRIFNRLFYRYGGHIELLRFKEDYGGMSTICSPAQYLRAPFWANFCLSFPGERL